MRKTEKEELERKQKQRADELADLRESEAFTRPSVSYGSNCYYGNLEKTQSTKHFVDNLMKSEARKNDRQISGGCRHRDGINCQCITCIKKYASVHKTNPQIREMQKSTSKTKNKVIQNLNVSLNELSVQSSSSEEVCQPARKTDKQTRKKNLFQKNIKKKTTKFISSSSSSDSKEDTLDEIQAFITTGNVSNLRRSKRQATRKQLEKSQPSSPPESTDSESEEIQTKIPTNLNKLQSTSSTSTFLQPNQSPTQVFQRPPRPSIPLNALRPSDRKSFPKDTPIQPNQDPTRVLPSRLRNRDANSTLQVQFPEKITNLAGNKQSDEVLSPFEKIKTPAVQKQIQRLQNTIIASPKLASLYEDEKEIIRVAAEDIENRTNLNLDQIKAICNRKLNNRLASERYAKTSAGYYKSYVITEKISEDELHLYHFDDHQVEKYQRGFVVVLKKIREYRGDGSRFTIFRKFLQGEEWDDMSAEDLKRAKLFDFDAEDFEDIPDSGTVLKRYQLPIRDSDGNYKTNWLSIDENGRIMKNPIIEKGFGQGQSKIDFTGVAMVLNKTNVSANVGNQIVSSTINTLYERTKQVSEDIAEILEPVNFSLSRSTFRNVMKGALEDAPEFITTLMEKLDAFTFAYDAKTVKYRTGEKIVSNSGKEVLVSAACGKDAVEDVCLGGHPTIPDDNDGDKTAESLFLTLCAMVNLFIPDETERKHHLLKCVGITFDTTSVNTGWKSGVNIRWEVYIGRSVLHLACRSHIADTISKFVFHDTKLDGPTKGSKDAGGPLSKLFGLWNEWVHVDENWRAFKTFVKSAVEKEGYGVYHGYDGDDLEDLRKVVQWIHDKNMVNFKNGDYRLYGKF